MPVVNHYQTRSGRNWFKIYSDKRAAVRASNGILLKTQNSHVDTHYGWNNQDIKNFAKVIKKRNG